MHHTFIDKFSDGNSLLHKWDPRLKLVALVCLISVVSTLRPIHMLQLWLFLIFTVAAILLTRLPVIFFLKRVLFLGPFVALMGIAQISFSSKSGLRNPDLEILISFVFFRAVLLVLILSLITATTKFSSLLAALNWFKMPKLILSILSFVYRYIFIIIGEAEQLNIARQSRLFNTRKTFIWKSYAWMVGTLLIRSIERSERVYAAMCLRGYNSNVVSPVINQRPSVLQYLSTLAAVLMVIFIRQGL